ncbi:50S ribosomal protein L16 [Patescibacteria group bacterium]|nr:50S ribosomal protein L16 [Patescibacteria group bacterium]
MLFPKKAKHRKWQTGRKNFNKVGVASRGNTISFGSHGLKAMAGSRLLSNQIEAGRRAAKRYIGKTGRIFIRVFPDRPFTSKPSEVKMGKGKGAPEGYCVPVKPGTILFEVDGVSDEKAIEALRKAGTKMPVKTKIISRERKSI